ncbi:MAG: hypothetical protein WBC59_07335 [Phycisphaerae bacterium]
MSKSNAQPPEEQMAGMAAVAQPAPGGSLQDYLAFVKETGRACLLSRAGTWAWVQESHGLLLRFPCERTEPIDFEEIRQALGLHGVRVVSYLLESDDAHPATCFHYVCKDPEYDVEHLSSHARRDIRRGLRRFTARLCTWDELAEKGYDVHVETVQRHGYTAPPPGGIRRYADKRHGTPFFDIWGAWEGDELVAWLSAIKVDNWAVINLCNSRTAALKNCPNNAILYLATRRLLVDEKRDFVSYGLSSVQVSESHLGLHKYKVRMGYEALPVHRVFVPRRLLRPLLKGRAASWMWDRMERLFPRSSKVRKVAGVSRLISGRQKSPLAWAEENG